MTGVRWDRAAVTAARNAAILAYRKGGVSVARIAALYGLSERAVQHIIQQTRKESA